MVLLRLVMPDAMRAVFELWPEVRMDDSASKKAEETTEAARKVCEELWKADGHEQTKTVSI